MVRAPAGFLHRSSLNPDGVKLMTLVTLPSLMLSITRIVQLWIAQDNMTEWDITLWCQYLVSVRQHYEAIMVSTRWYQTPQMLLGGTAPTMLYGKALSHNSLKIANAPHYTINQTRHLRVINIYIPYRSITIFLHTYVICMFYVPFWKSVPIRSYYFYVSNH